MEKITKADFQSIMQSVSKEVIKNEKYLCELDSFVGDGDHGVTAARGFKAVKKRMEEERDYVSIASLFQDISEILSAEMGGAIGPIIGSIFEGISEAVEGKEAVNLQDFAAMMRSGLENVMLIGGAKEGDSTLVDCLAPAVTALEEKAAMHEKLSEALTYSLGKAEEGTQATKSMIAKRGRAKFLAEKSLGYQDAGATSMLIILMAMKEYILHN